MVFNIVIGGFDKTILVAVRTSIVGYETPDIFRIVQVHMLREEFQMIRDSSYRVF